MSPEVLERFIREYIESQPTEIVSFAWQGGEPTLCGVDFFQQAVALQKRYANGRTIENSLQTNGTLLDDEWGAFLSANGFLVGISVDGPRSIHDRYRQSFSDKGSFDAVMRGLEVLKRHRVEFNTLTCVHAGNEKRPEDIYRFLRGIGARFQQYIPIVERRPVAVERLAGHQHGGPPSLRASAPWENDPLSRVSSWSVSPEGYGNFLVTLFNRWVRKDVGNHYIQLFDTALGKWLGIDDGGLCYFAPECGNALAMESDGSVYSCDHYVYPENGLGRIGDKALGSMAHSRRQQEFGAQKSECLPEVCVRCPVRFACNGDCPKHRFMLDPEGKPGLSYLCPAYKQFFTHIDPYMRIMASLRKAGREPAEIVELLKQKRIPGLS